MSAAREAVRYLAAEADRFAAYATALEEAGRTERAFDAIQRARWLEAEAGRIARLSGDAELMLLWERR